MRRALRSLIERQTGVEWRSYRKGTSSGEERVYEVWRYARWHHKIVLWRAG